MASIQKLREQRDAIAKALHNMVDLATEGLTVEQRAEYDKGIDDIDRIDSDIKRFQQLLDRDTQERAADRGRADRTGVSEDEAHHLNALDKAVMNAWIRGGSESLTAEQRDHVRAKQIEAKRVYGALAVGTDSAGGYTVDKTWVAAVQLRLKAYGGVREVATVIQTDGGNDINYPTSDGTSETGELIGENTTATELDASFGTVAVKAYKYSSKFIAVPFELLQDSIIDVEAFLQDRLATRIGRATGAHFTTGTGSGQPQGVVTAAGSVTAAAASAIAYNDLVDLQHAIDPAYRKSGRARFMMNDAILKVIRKLQDSQGHPLWMPNIGAAVPATLLGDEYVINQHMGTSMASAAKSVLYGDFSQYVVRDAMQMQLFRFTDSAFIKLGQIGFLAWMRADGRCVAHTSTDVLKVLAHP